MQKHNRKLTLIAFTTVFTTLIISACGGAAAIPPTIAPPTSAPPTTVPTAVPQPTVAPPTVVPTAVPPTTVPPTIAPTPVPATIVPTVKPTIEPTAAADTEVARPSNPGGPGPAASLVGNIAAGTKVFADQCVKCHGDQGKVGKTNPGSTDGTVPVLNPIDATLIDKDNKVTIVNLDLFLEHGSTPGGKNPVEKMTAFGDEKKLTPQQIADVIAYVISLNK